MPNKQLKKAERPKKFVISAFSRLMEEGRDYDKSAFYLPRQYTNRARKPLIFLDFLKLTEKIYYLFTTYQNY